MGEQFANGYALLIAVDENEVSDWALPDVAKDVGALEAVLKNPDRCAYPAENVKIVSGPAATRRGIVDGLEWLQDHIDADTSGNATAIIYYTGHGWRDETVTPPAYYLVPYDVQRSKVRTRALKIEDFAAEVEAVTPRRLMVVFDCCHSGGMEVKDLGVEIAAGYRKAALETQIWAGGEGTAPSSGAKGLEELTAGAGRAVLSSSQGEEVSYVRKDGSMSIFTYHLIEALTGHAQPQEGATEVLVSDVMGHVWRTVPQSAKQDWNGDQNPDYQVSGNFPVALLLGGQGWTKGLAAPSPLAEAPAPTEIHRTTTEIDTGGGAYIGGNVSTGGGDFVGRDQVVHTEIRYGLGSDQVAAVFRSLNQRSAALPEGPAKIVVKSALEGLEAESQKGAGAKETEVVQWFTVLAQMAPDIFEVAVNSFINPVQGLSTVFQKVAQRMKPK